MIHSFYSARVVSGENIVVKGQIEALKGMGHEVELFARHTDIEADSFTYGFRSAFRVITGFGFNFKQEIKHFDPDLILVHNLFPNISTRWLERVVAKRIIFLHNFRPWCSNGLMLRDGKSCQKCLRNPFWGSIYKCANGSLLRSFIQSLGYVFNYNLERLEKSGAQIVAVSKFTQESITKFSNLENVGVLSHFISPLDEPDLLKREKLALPPKEYIWAGRISAEKGLLELLNIWPSSYTLDIFGGGPELARLMKIHGGKTNISFKGSVSNENLRTELPKYRGFVNSSTCKEFGPLTIIEALSAGLPIIYPSGLPLGDIISKYGAGEEYTLSNPESLRNSLARTSDQSQFEQYEEAATLLFSEEFSLEGWYKQLISLYAVLK